MPFARRLLPLVVLVPLAACHGGAAGGNDATSGGPTAHAERIACQPAGAESFSDACTVDRSTDDRGLILTLRNPDGGFHRVRVTRDGRGVIAADGAEGARVTMLGADQIEVAVAGDRYRLPAHAGHATP